MSKNNANQRTMEELRGIATGCARVLDDHKGADIKILNLDEVHSEFTFFVVVTGNSVVHCRSLAKNAEEYLDPLLHRRTKPRMDSNWIALDFNDVVVHVFTEDQRQYYNLEKLWGDAERVTWHET